MTAGAANVAKRRLFPALAACWLATAVLPGFALQGSQTPQSRHSSTQVLVRSSADDFYEQEVMKGKAGFTPCPKSSDAHTLAILNRSLRRWQGKTIAIVGDSLMDTVYESLACSGVLSGAQLPFYEEFDWPPQRNRSIQDKLPLNSSATSRPSRFNRVVFEEDWENVVTLEQIRFYDYPTPVLHPLHTGELNEFWDKIFDRHADILFVNLAHQAFFDNGTEIWESVMREIIRGAEYCGVLRKLVLLGHPPQHFDTPSGAYTKEAYKKGACKCHGQELMQLQPLWQSNGIVAKVAREFNIPYVDTWAHYLQACKYHKSEKDCTHWLPDLSVHVRFVEELLRKGEHAIGISAQ